MHDMLDMDDQCEYILWFINKKTRAHTHTLRKIADKNHSNMNKKNKMK